MVRGVEKIGVNFVRLSGPLKVKRVVPVHNYTGVLPFQGSIDLGDREVMTVTVHNPAISGVVRLRGAVYDEYGGGGWKAGARTSVDLPKHIEKSLQAEIESGDATGEIIPLTITVERKSVVGTVLFSPGEPLATSVSSFDVDVPASGLETRYVQVEDGGEGLPDEDILTRIVAEELGDDYVGLTAQRDEEHGLVRIGVMEGNGESLPDSLVTRPASRVGENRSYNISGFIPIVPEEELRAAGNGDPAWVRDQYLHLPADLPARISALAADITKDGATRYDKAVLAQDYLRAFPIDFDIADTPPGRDTVDYFLFDSQRGYFDYHASALTVMLRTLGHPFAVGGWVRHRRGGQGPGERVVQHSRPQLLRLDGSLFPRLRLDRVQPLAGPPGGAQPRGRGDGAGRRIEQPVASRTSRLPVPRTRSSTFQHRPRAATEPYRRWARDAITTR